MTNEKVLITGATGYIGRHVLKELAARGDEVHCLNYNSVVPDVGSKVVVHEQNVLDLEGTKRVVERIGADKAIHIAWYVEHKDYVKSDENFRWFEASRNLIDSFYLAGGRRFIGMGTCFEEIPVYKDSPYVKCKRDTREYLQGVSDSCGTEHAWARLFYSYGTHERPERFVPWIIRSLAQGKEVGPKHGQLVCDYIFSEDMAKQIVDISESFVDGKIDVGTGKGVRLAEIAETIGDIMGKRNLVKCDSEPSAQPASVVADMSRYEKEVGDLRLNSLREGLEKTVAWHLQNL